jgi:hypothetical protein
MKFKVNGRSVSPNKLGDAILSSMQGDIQKAAEKQVIAKLSSIRCPVHHQTPRNIRFEGSILKGSQARMDCCCDQLEEAVKRALN